MTATWLRFLMIAIALSMSGCNTIRKKIADLVVDKAATQSQIDSIKKEYETKSEAKVAEVSKAKDAVIAAKDAQIKEASNGLYGADATFKTISSPVRTDLIINNFVNESWVAIGRQAPDYNTLVKINERVKKELDEKATSLAELRSNHEKIMAENQKLTDQTKKALDDLAQKEKEKQEIVEKYTKDLSAKQKELIETQDKLISLQKQREEDMEALKNIKTKFSVILGILALLGLAGAIYSPVFKAQLAMFAGLCGVLSYGIWLVQPWHVGVTAAALGVGLICWILYKHHKEERVADALVLATQDLKENAGEVWESKVKPAIEERLKKYKKGNNGKLVAVQDHSIEKYIDNKLAEYDAK